LKAPGFNPRAYEVKTRFQILPSTSNLRRYNAAMAELKQTEVPLLNAQQGGAVQV
jgi:hypothetical protein